jgi:hypothetical protein
MVSSSVQVLRLNEMRKRWEKANEEERESTAERWIGDNSRAERTESEVIEADLNDAWSRRFDRELVTTLRKFQNDWMLGGILMAELEKGNIGADEAKTVGTDGGTETAAQKSEG